MQEKESYDLFTNPETGDTMISFGETAVPEAHRALNERLIIQTFGMPSYTEFDWIDCNTCVIRAEDRYYEYELLGSC